MTQSQPLRLQARQANRVAGWLLAVFVGFLWFLTIVFALLSLAILSQHGAIGLASCLMTGLICFLAILLTGKFHDALAVYEFTLQGVSKRSPFREQRANWSDVAGWAISESDGIWWLLDRKGRVLLSLEWLDLPNEQVPAAKAFIAEHLLRLSLSAPSIPQPFLSRLFRFLDFGHFHRAELLLCASLIGYWLARKAGEDFIAMIAAFVALMSGMAILVGSFLARVSIYSVFRLAKFLVCGDQLIETASGVIIHLPSVQRLERTSDGITLVGANEQAIFIPSHLTALWDYLRTRLPSEWQE